MLAAERGQRLKVVYFAGAVGQGKIPMEELSLPHRDPWDGVGLGGSQKCEVATLDQLRDQLGAQFEYDEVDVNDFMKATGAAKMKHIRQTLAADGDLVPAWMIISSSSLLVVMIALIPYLLEASLL